MNVKYVVSSRHVLFCTHIVQLNMNHLLSLLYLFSEKCLISRPWNERRAGDNDRLTSTSWVSATITQQTANKIKHTWMYYKCFLLPAKTNQMVKPNKRTRANKMYLLRQISPYTCNIFYKFKKIIRFPLLYANFCVRNI